MVITKDYDVTSDEFQEALETISDWLFDQCGPPPSREIISALVGVDRVKFDELLAEYTAVRGSEWRYQNDIDSVTRKFGNGWQYYSVYSMQYERVEILLQFDNDHLALQCKLAAM
jgi:hypothetical protein